MNTLSMNDHARSVLSAMDALMATTGDPTLARYLLHMATVHPKEVTLMEMAEVLKLTKSRISRATRELHRVNYAGAPGLDLVDIYFDVYNPRVKLVKLNDRGLRLVQDALG